jgi:hypothetical protein
MINGVEEWAAQPAALPVVPDRQGNVGSAPTGVSGIPSYRHRRRQSVAGHLHGPGEPIVIVEIEQRGQLDVREACPQRVEPTEA